MTDVPTRFEIEQAMAQLEALFLRFRGAGDIPSLDLLQQHLFLLGAQIGEVVDAFDAGESIDDADATMEP